MVLGLPSSFPPSADVSVPQTNVSLLEFVGGFCSCERGPPAMRLVDPLGTSRRSSRVGGRPEDSFQCPRTYSQNTSVSTQYKLGNLYNGSKVALASYHNIFSKGVKIIRLLRCANNIPKKC